MVLRSRARRGLAATAAAALAGGLTGLLGPVDPSQAVVNPAPASALEVSAAVSPTRAHPDDPVTYTITVSAANGVTLTGVAVTDQLVPACARKIGTLTGPRPTTYTCTSTAPEGDRTHAVVVTGSDAAGDTLTGRATAPLTVVDPATATRQSAGDRTVDKAPGRNDAGPAAAAEATGPALTLVKSADVTGPLATVGQPISYDFAVTNSGDVTLSDISVADTLAPPAGPEITVTCPPGDLAPGDTTHCSGSYPVTQADLDSGAVDNSATASGADPDGGTVTSNASTATVPVAAAASLKLTKTVQPDTATAVGDLVSYSFLVENTGNVTVHALTVEDTMSPPAGPAPEADCPDTVLAPTESTTCTADYRLSQDDVDAGRVDNSAQAVGTDPAGDEVDSNESTATVTVASAGTLSLVKDASPGTVHTAGDTVDYTFTVHNTGNVTLHALAIDDSFDPPADPGSTPIDCADTTLGPDATTTCTATYTAGQDDIDHGSIHNTATATARDPAGGSVASAPASATVTAVAAPALTLDKSATPDTIHAAGDVVTYSFVVTNTGNVTVTDLSITDTFTAPAGPLSAIDCPADTLAPTETVTCTATYTAGQDDIDAGKIHNRAVATGTDPAGDPVTSPRATADVAVTQSPGLSLSKTALPTTVTAAGQHIVYSFAVTNDGNVTVDGITIADTLAAPAGPQLSGIDCPVTTLAPAATVTCTASYLVTQDDIDHGYITNRATASGTAPDSSTVASDPDAVTVDVTQLPALTLVKGASTAVVTRIGQAITYTFRVTNTGNVTVSDIAVGDTFDAPGGVAVAPVCPLTTLEPARSTTCTAGYVVTAADFDRGAISNTAVAVAAPPSGPDVASPPSSLRLIARSLPGIALVKAATVTDVDADGITDLRDTIQWSFVVTNTGNVSLGPVQIDDAIAGPVTCPLLSLAAAHSMTCTADAAHVITQADVDAGRVNNTATAVGDPVAGGDPRTSLPSSTSTPIGPRPELAVVKSGELVDLDHNGRADVGDGVRWAFAVVNTGNVTVTGLTIDDRSAGSATCHGTTLSPGANTRCVSDDPTPLTRVDLDRGEISNTATATGTDPTGTPVSSPPATASVPLTGEPALSLGKSAAVTHRVDDGRTRAGDTIVWSFVVGNIGNVTLDEVTVDDPTAGAVTCPAATLPAGAVMTCQSQPHTITVEEAAAGHMVNTATVSGSWDGRTVTSAPSTATVDITDATTQPVTGPIAYTGPAALPRLIRAGVLALLAGVLLLLGPSLVRRPRRE